MEIEQRRCSPGLMDDVPLYSLQLAVTTSAFDVGE